MGLGSLTRHHLQEVLPDHPGYNGPLLSETTLNTLSYFPYSFHNQKSCFLFPCLRSVSIRL